MSILGSNKFQKTLRLLLIIRLVFEWFGKTFLSYSLAVLPVAPFNVFERVRRTQKRKTYFTLGLTYLHLPTSKKKTYYYIQCLVNTYLYSCNRRSRCSIITSSWLYQKIELPIIFAEGIAFNYWGSWKWWCRRLQFCPYFQFDQFQRISKISFVCFCAQLSILNINLSSRYLSHPQAIVY